MSTMNQRKKCLLCNTENVKYDAEFLEQRAQFCAPKLRELRIKWNDAITKIHPILKYYVDNVNTYQICDLHFRESDIKKTFESNGSSIILPISKWGLKIEALPLSSKELEHEKTQKTNTNLPVEELNIEKAPKEDKSQIENEETNQKGNHSETHQVNLGENSQENTPMNEVKEDEPGNNNESEKMEEPEEDKETQKGQEIQEEQEYKKEQESEIEQELEKSLSFKEIQFTKDKAPEKDKFTPIKIGAIRTDFRKSVEVKFSPYPIAKSFQQGVKTKANQIVQIKSGKNQIFVVPPGAQVIPFSPRSSTSSTSPSVMPFSILNPNSPTIRVPLITQVTSLQKGSPITIFIPVNTVGSKPRIPPLINNVIPITKVLSDFQVPLVGTIPLVTRVNPSYSAAKMTPVSEITKVTSVPGVSKVNPISTVGNVPSTSGVSNVSSISVVGKVPSISAVGKVTPTSGITKVPAGKSHKSVPTVTFPSSPPLMKVPEKYDKDQLLWDLQRCPLPTGWAYTLSSEDKILFTQYCIHRRFPIFLRLDNDMTGMISVGHLATNFIPYKLKLECYANIINHLRRMECQKWCIGIGFNNNNHSDLCAVLSKRINSRCKACAKIRKNEQRNETEEILRRQRQKPATNLKQLTRNLKRINERLEAKVCKLKLMVAHLKNKQCVDCLHDRFMKKTLSQTDSASNTASKSD